MEPPQVGDIWELWTRTEPQSVDHFLLIEYKKTYMDEEAWEALHLESGDLDTVWISNSPHWMKVA